MCCMIEMNVRKISLPILVHLFFTCCRLIQLLMMEEKIDFSRFELLTNAPNKESIVSLFEETYRCRFCGLSDTKREKWSKLLSIKEKESDLLFDSILSLINKMLYESLNDGNKIISIFPSTFHEKLKKMICKILLSKYDYWRNAAKQTTISCVPQLIDFGMYILFPFSFYFSFSLRFIHFILCVCCMVYFVFVT